MAEGTQPDGGALGGADLDTRLSAQNYQGAPGEEFAGTMLSNNGGFGFIKQDIGKIGGSDLFVLPGACIAFGGVLPQLGQRVIYRVTEDPTNGRPRADDVRPAEGEAALPVLGVTPPQPTYVTPPAITESGELSYDTRQDYYGTMLFCTAAPKYGFIKQDLAGDKDMFVLPTSCIAFGGVLPEVGTRVVFKVDLSQNRPQAEDVRPADEAAVQLALSYGAVMQPANVPATFDYSAQASSVSLSGTVAPFPSGVECTGTMLPHNGKFGFLKPDVEDGKASHLLVHPTACIGFGFQLPPVGTRVVYNSDPGQGRPRVANVRPADPAAPLALATAGFDPGGYGKAPVAAAGTGFASQPYPPVDPVAPAMPRPGTTSGIMKANNINYGFIKQDSGEEDIFVMPRNCEGFRMVLPMVGTRLTYTIGVDESRPDRFRAQHVYPE